MPTRYLEISSSSRMRDDFPQVAEFEVINGTTNASASAEAESLYLPEFPEYSFVGHANQSYYFMDPYTAANPSIDFPGVYTLYNGYIATDSAFTEAREVKTINISRGEVILNIPFTNPPTPLDYIVFLDPSPGKVNDYASQVNFNIQTFGTTFQQFPVTTSAYYVGKYLCWESAPAGTNIARRIVQYEPEYRRVVVESPFTGYIPPYTTANSAFSIRAQPPFFRGVAVAAINPKFNTVTLDASASAKDGAYVGMYLYIKPDSADPVYPNVRLNKITFNEYVYRIIGYTGSTRQARLERPVQYDVATTIVGRLYEILSSPKDSYSPLQFTGSTVALSEPRCESVGLISLILPNVELVTGSRIAFYPYVFVELRNLTSSKTMGRDIIYSNNPNSSRAIFVCPITDISRPTRTPFIKISASGMRQSIKFKPNDTFLFRVYLPDGSLFQPVTVDNPSPLAPNPLLQIEAVFSFAD